jgi:lipopolysaccharide export system protein LptA
MVLPMHKTVHLSATLVAVAALAFAGVAMAQIGSGDQPIQVEADNIDYQPQRSLALFSGNAVVIQGQTVLRSANLRVAYRGSDIDKVFADTEVFYTSPTERVRGDRAVFDVTNDTVTFSGNVIVTQGQNVVRGQQLVLNTETNASTMRGMDGRVRAVFFPDRATKSPAKTAPKQAPKR